MRLPHTLLNESFRLQFPFVFRQLQSLQLLLLAHPCLPVSLPTFSGLPLSRPVAASASLSDPRCFRFLSSASVLGSDYSASVFFLSLLFLFPPHSGFLSAPLLLSLLRFSPFFPAWFPVHSFPVPVLSYAVSFLSPFLASLPQLFHECLPSFPLSLLSGIFRSASASFRLLLLSFRLLGLLFLPFRSSRFCLSVASPVPPLRFRFLAFPVPSRLVSHPFSPGFRTRLSDGFLSSFPASLPQLFHR